MEKQPKFRVGDYVTSKYYYNHSDCVGLIVGIDSDEYNVNYYVSFYDENYWINEDNLDISEVPCNFSFEKIMNNFWIIFFGLISVVCLIGGFYGYPWQFYTAAMAALIAGVMYVASKEDLNLKK